MSDNCVRSHHLACMCLSFGQNTRDPPPPRILFHGPAQSLVQIQEHSQSVAFKYISRYRASPEDSLN